MKRTILTLIIIFVTALTAMAQATQPCVVKQYNQKQQKSPLAGVQVTVSNAGNTTSGADGRLTLTFRTLKPGDRVSLISAKKPGYEIFNKQAVEQWIIARGATFELVLVRSDYFAQLKEKLTQSSTDSYKVKYEQALRELEKQKKAGKMKEAEYNQKLDELETNYQNQLTNLDNYIDQFARIDLSEVSAEEQRILDMVEEGKIDEAVKAYEALDISGKLRQARENKKALSEAKARIEEEEAQQEQAIKNLKEKQQREIATLKLAGGKENYDKVARILKENALADTTDIHAIWEYADFAHDQHDFKDVERFYFIALNGSKDNLDLQATFQNNLGNLYADLHDYAKAEEYYLKALENNTQLFSQDPYVYHADLATTQHNLGTLYDDLHNYAKAEEYYLKALENRNQLFRQNPDAYREDLSDTQNNLGFLYYTLHDYAKAEEYYLQAMENKTLLFSQNPDAFRASLATTQNNLGIVYSDLHNYAKAEEYYLQALENRNQLFRQNPDAFRASLAQSQNNLGNLYYHLHDYTKAEEYYLKALENKTQLFTQHPDAYRADLANAQHNLGALYSDLHDYAKAEKYYLKALENLSQLFRQNPDAFRADIAETQNSLGTLYDDLHDYTKAEEHYLQALENYTKQFSQNPDAYRADLADTQYNLGNLYIVLHDYAKAEEHYLQALENHTQLFNQSPDIYRLNLALTQWNLMLLYGKHKKDWENFDEMLEQALKNYEILAQKDSRYQKEVDKLREFKQQRAAAKGQ